MRYQVKETTLLLPKHDYACRLHQTADFEFFPDTMHAICHGIILCTTRRSALQDYIIMLLLVVNAVEWRLFAQVRKCTVRKCAQAIFRMVFKNNPPALENLLSEIILMVNILQTIHACIKFSQILRNLQFSGNFRTVQFFCDTPCIICPEVMFSVFLCKLVQLNMPKILIYNS